MPASKVCLRCSAISADFRSPCGRRFRSAVLKVAMLYWQFSTARSDSALLRGPRVCGGKAAGVESEPGPEPGPEPGMGTGTGTGTGTGRGTGNEWLRHREWYRDGDRGWERQ